MQLFANNVTVFVTNPISSASLSIVVDDASKLPVPTGSDFFLLTFFQVDIGVESNWEIVKVTGVAGNTITVPAGGRGFDGTTARGWGAGAIGQMRSTRSTLATATSNAEAALNNAASAVATANNALVQSLGRNYQRPQVVATRGRFPVNPEGGGGTNYTRFESTLVASIGPRPVNSIQVLYCSRYATGGGEIFSGSNDYALESAIFYSGLTVPMSFSGWKSPTLVAGAAMVISDKIGYNLPAGILIQLRSGAIVASGQKVPGGMTASFQYGGYSSTASVSQVYNATAMSIPSGGAASVNGFVPLAVIGIPDQRHPAAILWGDSITYGTGDGSGDSTFGHIGWAERGLIGASGGLNMPFVNVSRSGDGTTTWASGAAAYQGTRWALLEYVTHAIFAMGTNDISSGITLANLQSNVQAAWASARRMGVRAYQTTLTPKTTSTDNWATIANQSVVANYTTTGIRGQFNAWLPSQVAAGNLDGIIDVNAAVCDPANADKWAVNGTTSYLTTDGLHPTSAGHILMAAALNANASTWAV